MSLLMDRSLAAAPRLLPRVVAVARDVAALSKPRITTLVVFTAAVGYGLEGGSATAVAPLLIGLALVVAGANAFNQLLERDIDGKMERTADRPLPAGRMVSTVAFGLGLAWSVAGLCVLALGVNPLATIFAAAGLLSYVLVYTPLKRVSPWALHAGAVPGALPTLVGTTAAIGRVDSLGLSLFAILFCWQIPHFLALATYRREDYARAGLPVAPVAMEGKVVQRHLVGSSAILLLACISPWLVGEAGTLYLATALLVGGLFLAGAARCPRGAIRENSRKLFLFSLVYLPGVLIALMLDRGV